MKFFSTLLLAGAAQASVSYTSNGVTYTITKTKDGVEVPGKEGPTLDMTSKAPIKTESKEKIKAGQESSNWCGMVDTSAPSGTWTNIYGFWTVPQISLRSGQSDSDEPSIAQWVGIDGDGCGSGLIQGGTVSQVGTHRHYLAKDSLTPNRSKVMGVKATTPGGSLFQTHWTL